LELQRLEEFLSIPANATMVPNDLTQYCLCIYSISQLLGFIDAFRLVAKTSEYDISIFGDWSGLNDKKKSVSAPIICLKLVTPFQNSNDSIPQTYFSVF